MALAQGPQNHHLSPWPDVSPVEGVTPPEEEQDTDDPPLRSMQPAGSGGD